MKRSLFLVMFLILVSAFSTASAKDVYRLGIGRYKVSSTFEKRSIEPGTFVFTAKKENHFVSKVSVGESINAYGLQTDKDSYYIEFSLVDPDNTELNKTDTYKSYTVELQEGQYVYIHTDDVILTRTDSTDSFQMEMNQVYKNSDSSDSSQSQSSYHSVPYVSSKNIIIDSAAGAELVADLGSGIILTSYTGDDCFSVKEVDSNKYRIMPKKPGKGAIVYEINFKKRIKVNVTVTKSAMITEDEVDQALDVEEYHIAKAIKGANLRAEPNADSEKVGSVKQGERLKVIKSNYTDGWHQVEYRDQVCFISAKLVELK